MTQVANRRSAMIGILAIGFAMLAAGATSGALGGIGAAFPGIDHTTVALIATLPTLLAVPFSLLSGKLADRGVPLRTLALAGIGLITVAGVAPAWFNGSFALILFFRALVGVGIGLMNAVSGSMSLLLFNRETAEKLSGWSSAMSNVGAIVLQFLGGYLCDIDWRNTFLVYLVLIAVFLVCFITLPGGRRNNEVCSAAPREPMGRGIVGWCAMYAVFALCFYPLITGIARVITNNGYGTATQGGACLSVFTLGGLCGSLLFPRLVRVLNRGVISAATALAAAGFLLVLLGQGLGMMFAGAAVFGLGYGCFSPAMIIFGAGSVPAGRAAFAMSLLMACHNLGGFCSAYLVELVGGALGITWDRFGFVFGCIGFTVLFLVSLVLAAAGRAPNIPEHKPNPSVKLSEEA